MTTHEAKDIINQIANKYNLPSIESQSNQHDSSTSKQLTDEIVEECSTSSRAPSERLIQLIERIDQQCEGLNLDLVRITSAITTVPIIARINPRLIWFLHTNQIIRIEEFVDAICRSQQSFEIFTTSFARQLDSQLRLQIRSEPTDNSPVTQMVLYIYQLALPFVVRDYDEHKGAASTDSTSVMSSEVMSAMPSARIMCRLMYPPPLAGVNDQTTIDSVAVSLQARREVLWLMTSRLHPAKSLTIALKSHFVAFLMLSPSQNTMNQIQIDQSATWMINRHQPEQVAECIRLSIVVFDSWVIRASGRRRNKRSADGNVKHDEFMLPTETIQAVIHSLFRILRNSQPMFEMLTTCLDYAWKHQSAVVLARTIQVARILLDQSSQFGVHLTLQRKNAPPVTPFKPPADFTQWWKLRIEPLFTEAANTLNDGVASAGSSPDKISSAKVVAAKSKRKPAKFALKQAKTAIDDDVAVLDDEAILTMDVDPELLNASKDTAEQRRINRARRVDAEERRTQFERQAEAERLRQAKVNASTLLHCLEMTVEFDPEFILSMLRRWTQQFLSGVVDAKRLQSYLNHVHRRCHQIEL